MRTKCRRIRLASSPILSTDVGPQDKMKTIVLLVLISAFLLGCATSPAKVRKENIEHKLDAIVIPEIDLPGANVYDAVNFLSQETMERDPNHKGINILIVPSDQVPVASMCFKTREISVREALNIICELTGYVWTIEDSVVKIRGKTRKIQTSAGDSSPAPDAGFRTPEN